MARSTIDSLPAGRFFCGPGFSFDLNESTLIMGIINATPDSFSGDGLGNSLDAAIRQAERMIAEGADIIDIGGESTRPGSRTVSEDEELARVLPVIKALRERSDTPISIDTYKSGVAREAIEAGAAIINDISGFRFDPRMAELCARTESACVLMHILGQPKTMQDNPVYRDLIGEILQYLAVSADLAQQAGVKRERIAIDPGIGFGKTLDDNLEILARLREFCALGYPVLAGVSRKAFIGHLLGGAPPDKRLEGTLGAVSAAVLNGAGLVRVHDVKPVRRMLQVTRSIGAAAVSGGRHVA